MDFVEKMRRLAEHVTKARKYVRSEEDAETVLGSAVSQGVRLQPI